MANPSVYVKIPLRTVSAANEREHHMERARRVKAERWGVGMVLNPHARPALPVVVELVRVSPHFATLDDDNLRSALKATRDEVARWLGIDDADARVRWDYGQERGRDWGVRIDVRSQESES